MALGWLRGGRIDHPMADPKRAREIISELPANDPLKAIGEIAEWLESLNQTGGFRADRRFELVDLLDGAAKNLHRKLAQDYLSMSRQQKFQENRLWNAIYGFWRHLGDAYLRCIKELDEGGIGMSSARRNAATIVARAIRALALQLKWTLLRYGPVESRIWTELGSLYRLAEQKGFANGLTTIYPGAHGAGTVTREFLKAIMLSASSTDGLPPVRQEIAERVVAFFSEWFVLSARPEGCTHCIDMSSGMSPVRLFKGVEPRAPQRFFGAGEALGKVTQLAAQIERSGIVPSDVNLGGNYDKDLVLGVLNHVAQNWSDKPPARTSERRPYATRITVVPGLDEILVTLDPSSSDELDFSEERAAESWIVENMSEGGYGAIIPAQKSDWVKVGTLIGLQGETSKYWGLGLIRRIARDEHNQRRVGIQLLTKTAIPIKVARSGNSGETQSAVLLSTSPDKSGEVGVVLSVRLFNGRDSLDMIVRDKSYLLMPSRLVEEGEDFSWAKFKVMQRSA